jgi:hypothetical protein
MTCYAELTFQYSYGGKNLTKSTLVLNGRDKGELSKVVAMALNERFNEQTELVGEKYYEK